MFSTPFNVVLLLMLIQMCKNTQEMLWINDKYFAVDCFDSKCTYFRFKYCAESQASGRSQSTVISDDWSVCLEELCSMTEQDQKLETIKQCQVHKQQKLIASQMTVTICLSLVLPIVAFMIIMKVINYCKKRARLRNEQIESTKDLAIQAMQQITNMFNHQKCSICLFPKNDISLQCCHSFHLKCILAWIKRSDNCPVCRNDMKWIHLFCFKCHVYYNKINAKQQRKGERVYFQQCDQCRPKQNQKIESQNDCIFQ